MVLDEYKRLERIRAIYTQITPSLVIMAISVYTLSFIALWPVYDKPILMVWFISGLIITFLRKRSAMIFAKQELTTENCDDWARRAIVWAFLSGVSWGFIYVFFTSPDHFFRLLILFGVYGALTSLSSSNFGAFFPVYFVFALPATLMFTSKLIYIGGDIYYIAAALIVAYFIEMTSISLTTQKSFNKTSKLRFSNSTLIQEMLTQKETAENAVLAKNHFLAAASHDLRQPLHAQGLFVSAIKDQPITEEAHEIVSKIQLSTEALNSLLNSLLDISQLDAQSMKNTPKDMPLNIMIEGIAQEYDEPAKQNNSELLVDISSNLSVHCDEALLYRLLRNLIDNAVKFTNNGTINISAKSQGPQTLITISDTGKGIPDNQQERVFREFTQLDNPERDRQKGLGLGLAIVKRLSNLMGINIEMSSEYGFGTTFTLQLPSNIDSPIETRRKALIHATQTFSNKAFQGQVILVIDDEIEILDGMKNIITAWHATPVTATDAQDAIQKLNERGLRADLIMADYRLRDNKKGIDEIKTIRNHFGIYTNAILVTGETSPDNLKLALSQNITILHKPTSPKLLREAALQVITNLKKGA